MNPNGQIIPIAEDDQGEGYKDILNEFDIKIIEKFDDSDFAEKMEKFQRRKSNKITR